MIGNPVNFQSEYKTRGDMKTLYPACLPGNRDKQSLLIAEILCSSNSPVY